MKAANPFPLNHSWPLFEQPKHFELGCILSCAVTDALDPIDVTSSAFPQSGCWECDLADNSLIWSGGVYDIFGLPRGTPINRREIVALYREESRAAMESLRAYAIRHTRGFTLDAEIRPAAGVSRWMRLIAAPICDGDRVVRLLGLKLII